GCLNRAAFAALDAVGLGHVPAACGATPFHQARIATGPGYAADVALPGGAAVSREAFDAALVHEASQAGATMRTGVRATVQPQSSDSTHIRLNAGGIVAARAVIVATGLAGNTGPAAAGSRVGVGTVLPSGTGPAVYEPGTICLAVGRSGYVGLVRVEDNRLDV